MRVLVVSHLYPSESSPSRGIFVAEQVGALLRQGITVDVLSARYDDAPPMPNADASGLRVRFIQLPWRGLVPSVLNVVSAATRLRGAIRNQLGASRYDVVHAHYAMPDGVAAIRATRGLGLPVVITLHGSDVNVQLRRPVVGAFLARALSAAERMVCVSPAMLDGVGRLKEGCTFIPNGYNARDISYEESAERDAILFVGGLNPVKNPDVLIRAYAAEHARLGCDLLVAGDGPMMPTLRVLAEKLGVSGRVHLLGNVEHSSLRGLYARATIAVLPSSSEGMPVSALEALASGVPLVCTRVGALPALVKERENGLLIPTRDVDALADALLRAVGTSWDRGRIARDPALLTWDGVAEKLIALYEDVAGVRR